MLNVGAAHSGTTARILMAAGGTGGHIFPALAVATELRARSERAGGDAIRYAIEFIGTRRQLESKLIPAAGFPLRVIEAAGLKGIGGVRKLRNLLLLPYSVVEAAAILREFQPHVVVGVGGYLAGPVMLEAALRDIPTVLIEPNARPGFTNRVLAPVVRAAAVGFEETARSYGEKAHLTGHPVRRAFFEIPPKAHKPPFTVLVVGGSQGSRAINQAVAASLPLIASDTEHIRIVHQTGERDYNEVRKAYHERGFRAEIRAFIEDMPGALAEVDLVVSRAGATAVAELAAAGRAALLIPFPAATDQHQMENARVLERAGAARVLVQSELTPERLVTETRELLAAPETLGGMEACARRLARPDAAARIADLVEALARE
jgi:UDP-N-acetylglucosamine--N-acetylmuramyl-(pentapeptide) pyrophosphoryl-undecaprenol N-acetylglucosamine transferase